jgi:hypothetical protein
VAGRPDDAEQVARCEIFLDCSGTDADGVYCPE